MSTDQRKARSIKRSKAQWFRLLSPLTAFVVISFVAGFIIGIKIYSDRSREAFLDKQKQAIRILTLKNLFPKSVKVALVEKTGWQLDFVEVDSPLDLWQRLEGATSANGFDLVTLYSYQVPLAFHLGQIQAVDHTRVQNFDTIHPDFRNLPVDPSFRNVVPLLWGINGIATHPSVKKAFTDWRSVLETKSIDKQTGLTWSETELLRIALLAQNTAVSVPPPPPGAAFQKLLAPWLSFAVFAEAGESAVTLLKSKSLKVLSVLHSEMVFSPLKDQGWEFRLPEGGGTLTVLNLALGRESRSESGAYALLSALQTPEITKVMVEFTHQASVNRNLEKDPTVDKRLKASYLRSIPIGNYILLTDYSRARDVHDLMLRANRRP